MLPELRIYRCSLPFGPGCFPNQTLEAVRPSLKHVFSCCLYALGSKVVPFVLCRLCSPDQLAVCPEPTQNPSTRKSGCMIGVLVFLDSSWSPSSASGPYRRFQTSTPNPETLKELLGSRPSVPASHCTSRVLILQSHPSSDTRRSPGVIGLG